ncbi:MarR family winged helix-turn-helix transcriptional regulator [Alkalihalobacterium bogoriense]|uniref:MarR family winged helix-turn-helix transcriptional regulator n=1 Tax=Alkalihalobacterium bogoriense TaxID=246272 RepID=UPI000A4CB3FF|nr:MarR family transcriptional regulator [Alkalihalobacterium bogoriense]
MLSLQEYISIKLHKVDLKLTGYIKAKLEPFNIAPEQNLIMMLLWEQDGLTQSQIAAKLNKDKTNIARMASNLEQKGFITRQACPHDKRSIKLFVTEKGEDLGKKVIPVAEQFNELVSGGFTKKELEELDRLLTKISYNLD